MPEIKLTRNFITLVDEEFYNELIVFKWYAQGLEGRPARRLKNEERQLIYMYHQILRVNPKELRLTGYEIDHIDRNPLNNHIRNLRIVKHFENMQNTITSINRRGIGRDNTHNTWKAYIDRHNKPRINIGTFKTEEEAKKAVNNWNTQK